MLNSESMFSKNLSLQWKELSFRQQGELSPFAQSMVWLLVNKRRESKLMYMCFNGFSSISLKKTVGQKPHFQGNIQLNLERYLGFLRLPHHGLLLIQKIRSIPLPISYKSKTNRVGCLLVFTSSSYWLRLRISFVPISDCDSSSLVCNFFVCLINSIDIYFITNIRIKDEMKMEKLALIVCTYLKKFGIIFVRYSHFFQVEIWVRDRRRISSNFCSHPSKPFLLSISIYHNLP